MFAKAFLRDLSMSPRKVDYVIRPIRRKTVAQAMTLLAVVKRRAAKPVHLLLASALANARQKDPAVREEELVISRATADKGRTRKKFRCAAFGRAVPILKRTTNLTLHLDRS